MGADWVPFLGRSMTNFNFKVVELSQRVVTWGYMGAVPSPRVTFSPVSVSVCSCSMKIVSICMVPIGS